MSMFQVDQFGSLREAAGILFMPSGESIIISAVLILWSSFKEIVQFNLLHVCFFVYICARTH